MILHYGDLIDGNCLVHIMNTVRPTEVYNLGAQSQVKVGHTPPPKYGPLMEILYC